MKKMIDLITEEIRQAFTEAGYDASYGRVVEKGNLCSIHWLINTFEQLLVREWNILMRIKKIRKFISLFFFKMMCSHS